MLHLPNLITDLGFILIIAALATLLFKKLGQPLVLGYLIAGFLVSPHVPFLPTVTDNESIKVWSEIGVIFLLFSLGLEFSFKKLFKVGGAASFTAVFEVLFMLGLGYAAGQLLGWNKVDSLFLGGILSISSTTIIVRAFQELGVKGQKFVELVFGILVVEDIVAILLLVVLAAIAASGDFSGSQLIFSGLRLLFYMALWFVVGIFFIPLFLRKTRRLLEDETILLVAIGLCFLMVIIAAQVGFSPALGAFVMGSLLAETPEGHHIEKLLQPVKDLFAAIFFVSVGMMIDPGVLGKYWSLILVITAITVFGKLLSTSLGALLSGQPRRQSLQAGFSLAQIGEFSFIIAALGQSLKVTSEFLYPVAIAVSAVTTFITPYLVKCSDPFYQWLEPRLPVRIRQNLDRYHAYLNQPGRSGAASMLMRAYGGKIFLNTVMIVAVIVATKQFLSDDVQRFLSQSSWAGGVSLALCLFISAPFFWGLLMGGPALKAQRELDEIKQLRALQMGLFIGRLTLALLLLAAMTSQFFSVKIASGALIAVMFLSAVFARKWVPRLYYFFEANFLKNLTDKERQNTQGSSDLARKFLPWEANISTFEVDADSSLAGQTLQQISFKERFGVSVAAVFRGSKKVFAPDGAFMIWPQDKLICFGSEDELQKFHDMQIRETLRPDAPKLETTSEDNFRLQSVLVSPDSPLKGRTIQDCRLRSTQNGMVVGIERGSQRILGPAATFELTEGDLIWLIQDLRSEKPLA